MARDDLPDSKIPSFAATRDEGVASAPRDAVPGRGSRPSAASAGMGLLARLVLTVALVVAAVSCAWAWQLQQILDKSVSDSAVVAGRVADLEALLSDTDESVEKSAAALGAQLNVVDKETRRLEQRRREMDNKVAKLEKASAVIQTDVGKLQTLIAVQSKTVTAINTDLKSLSADMIALKRVAGDLERLSKTAMDAQSNLERLADNVNKANLDRAAMKQRVTSNEEWIESINAFRRQVNASISRLEDQLRSSESASSAGNSIPGTP
jgi:chromosome segregation ATPase